MQGLPSRTTFPHHSVSTNTRTLQVLVEDPSIQDSIKPRTKAPLTLSMRRHINELLFIYYYYYYYYSIEVPNSFMLPLHFNAFRWDRPTRGGGVTIIIRNNISFRPVTVSVEFKHIEIVCIDFLLLNETCRFIMYYRTCGFSPDAIQYATDSIACLVELCNIKYRLVLLGDFNLPDIDWKCHNLPNNKIYSLFMDLFNEFGLHQFVNLSPDKITYLTSYSRITSFIYLQWRMLDSLPQVITPQSDSVLTAKKSDQTIQSHILEIIEEEILNF